MRLRVSTTTVREHPLLALAMPGMAAAAALWLWWPGFPAVQMPAVTLQESAEPQVASEPSPTSPVAMAPPELVGDRSGGADLLGFSAEEILNNPQCMQRPGRGPSKDVTVVAVATETGGRFATVDASGILYSHELPFSPSRFSVARRKDGSVLTVFDGAERKEPGLPGPEDPEPVRIYLDGQIIFDHQKTWLAQVADDGSSYSFIEPVAGGSRLLIRNLDHGTEYEYDLTGAYHRYISGELSHSFMYSVDNAEAMLLPGYDGIGEHHFFPASPNAGQRRMIHVQADQHVQHPVFASSEVGYFSFYLPETPEKYFLVRREFHWSGDGAEVEDRWLREGGSVQMISEDGSLLLLGVTLVDANTGATVFDLASQDSKTQLSGLRHILGPDATLEQMGQAEAQRLIGDELWIYRTLRHGDAEPSANKALDVFKLDGIHMDSGPAFRIPINYLSECAPGDTAYRGLQAHEGRLTYLTNRR